MLSSTSCSSSFIVCSKNGRGLRGVPQQDYSEIKRHLTPQQPNPHRSPCCYHACSIVYIDGISLLFFSVLASQRFGGANFQPNSVLLASIVVFCMPCHGSASRSWEQWIIGGWGRRYDVALHWLLHLSVPRALLYLSDRAVSTARGKVASARECMHACLFVL
jgi:hypothetical protein